MNPNCFNAVHLWKMMFLLLSPAVNAAEWNGEQGVDVEGILAARLDASALSQKAVLRASNGDEKDFFDAVAISGDTVVVGAPFEDSRSKGVNGDERNNRRENSGAAYVFVRSGNGWKQQAYLKAENPENGDQFGFSVAISGDTVVIGAYGEDGETAATTEETAATVVENSGAVYVFTREGSKWTQQAQLNAKTPVANGYFGYAVAISGETLVVGESGKSMGSGTETEEDTGLERAGAAHVFTRTGDDWGDPVELTASNAGAGHFFGFAVAISRDRLVVGAPGERGDDSKPRSGAAYVFALKEAAWEQQAYLKAGNPGAGDLFGRAVAIAGETVVVGAPQEDGSRREVLNSGATYVFSRSGKNWSQAAYLKAGKSQASAGFGGSVAVSGGTVVVGASDEDGKGRADDAGAAYVFVRDNAKWRQKSRLTPKKTGANDQFGFGVALADGVAVISASGEANNTGAAYLFEGVGVSRPEVVIEELGQDPLVNGEAKIDFGNFSATSSSVTKTVKIRNTGLADLTGIAVTLDGVNAANYAINMTGMSPSLLPDGSTTFTITFTPTSSATSGTREAKVLIASNDRDESKFSIALKSVVLSTTADKDGDGLNDWAEVQYKDLGFDWETANQEKVSDLKAGASAAGLFTSEEIQNLNVSTPLLVRDAAGKFKLTLGVEKSLNLGAFSPFTISGTSVPVVDGKMVLEFTSSEKAAFYRVQAK